MKNYSKISVEILDKVHNDVEVYTYTKEFKLREMTIPEEEITVLNKLLKSDFLNSDEFKGKIIEYINEERGAIDMDELEEQDLWNDLSITAFVTEKQRKEDVEGALKTGAYKLNLLDMESLEIIKVSILGEIEETDPEHGISITFLNNKVARIGQQMDYQFYIT